MSALALLAGCPNGATLDALKLNGCSENVLLHLVSLGLASSQVRRVLPDMRIQWFYITDAGIAELAAEEAKR